MNEQLILGLLLGFLVGDELLRGSRWLARWIRRRYPEPNQPDRRRP